MQNICIPSWFPHWCCEERHTRLRVCGQSSWTGHWGPGEIIWAAQRQILTEPHKCQTGCTVIKMCLVIFTYKILVGNSIIIVTVWFNDTNGSFGIYKTF